MNGWIKYSSVHNRRNDIPAFTEGKKVKLAVLLVLDLIVRMCLFQENVKCGTSEAEHHSVRRLLLMQVHNAFISDSSTVTFSVDPGFK